MKRKLYSNMQRMTSMFIIAIICVTVTTLALRLTVLGDLVIGGSGGGVTQVENGLFPYTIARRVHFDYPGARGDFRIENPETNEYYMSVEIIFPETGQVVFYTGFILPGETRGRYTLHVQLPEGVHECIARVTAHDPATYRPLGSQEQAITLHIG